MQDGGKGEPATTRTIMLVLEYDGTRFAGFQLQAGGATVQGEIEAALGRLTGQPVRVQAAGRTDAGVHARGQVVTFATASTLPPDEMQRALNALLPPDVAVRSASEATGGFHARFSAMRRAYRYTILNTPVRSPLLRLTTYHVASLLKVEAMHEAGQVLVGTHDFAAFGGPMRKHGATVRTVNSVTCRRDGDLVIIDIEANAYLSRMVRHIAGALIAVGRGALSANDIAAILASRDRNQAQAAVPAHGLCLMDIGY
jgi:tRNA pseudouridine38-40 synthase